MSEKIGSNWAFKMMSMIHDNFILRRISDPEKTLINAGLKTGISALEIGCGPGFFTIPAAKIVSPSTLYANDIHPLAIQRVKEKQQQAQVDNIQTLLASASSLDLNNDCIDICFLFGLPRLIKNTHLFDSVLSEVNRVLRVNGILAIKSSRSTLIEQVTKKGFDYEDSINGIVRFLKQDDI